MLNYSFGIDMETFLTANSCWLIKHRLWADSALIHSMAGYYMRMWVPIFLFQTKRPSVWVRLICITETCNVQANVWARKQMSDFTSLSKPWDFMDNSIWTGCDHITLIINACLYFCQGHFTAFVALGYSWLNVIQQNTSDRTAPLTLNGDNYAKTVKTPTVWWRKDRETI